MKCVVVKITVFHTYISLQLFQVLDIVIHLRIIYFIRIFIRFSFSFAGHRVKCLCWLLVCHVSLLLHTVGLFFFVLCNCLVEINVTVFIF